MMNKRIYFFHITALLVCLAILTLASLQLSSCDNVLEDKGGKYRITLDLSKITGISGRARSLQDFDDGLIEYFKIELSGPAATQSHVASIEKPSITVQVSAGTWTVKVMAYSNDGVLAGSGTGKLEVGPGKPNSVKIEINPIDPMEPGDPSERYTITYINMQDSNLKGDPTGISNPNPASYTAENLPLTLQEASRTDGAEFQGWYVNPNFNGDSITAIPVDAPGNITLYAKWTFNVDFYNGKKIEGDDSNKRGSLSVVEGGTIDSNNLGFDLPTLPGWDTTGNTATEVPSDAWYTTPYNDGATVGEKWDIGNDTVKSPTTLYARWETWDEQDFGSVNPVIAGVINVVDASGLQQLSSLAAGNYIVYGYNQFNTASISFGSASKVSIRGGMSLRLNQIGALFNITNDKEVILRGPQLAYTGTSQNNNPLVIVNGANAKFTMRNGSIQDNTNSSLGSGISIGNSGEFFMHGGEIKNNILINTTGSCGGGVYVTTNGSFTMTGGKISECKAVSGGGVYVQGGTFNLSGNAVISGNSSSGSGGGVYFGGANKTFTMSENAIISDNTSDSNGGGVFLTVVNSTFIMESGNITENKAQYGGGVYIFTGSFTINNGNITANNAGFCGGGVYKKAGEFNQGMGYITDNDAPFKPNYGTAEDISGVTATTWTDLANLINDTSKPSILFIGGLLKANSLINIDRDITLLSDIYSISRNGGYTGSFFTVASNKTLSLGRPNLQSNKLTLDGVTSGTDSATGALITVNGTLVMHDGVTLQDNNRSSGDGGGIYVSNGGTFNMLGGKISNCSAERGGGVNVNYGTFTMSGSALITENTSNGSGGGVWAGDSGFTLSENATISNNSTTGSGGGVFFGGGDFTMNGGIIGGNTADSPAGGGGVYIASGSFAKTGNSIIYGNDASDENKNRVLNGTGAELNGNVGHAVYYNVNPAKYRNITAGPAFDMGTNPLTGWD